MNNDKFSAVPRPLGPVQVRLGPTNPQPIRVLLADDHPVVRHGLASCLSVPGQIQVIGQAADGREAIKKAKELRPDVVLLDIDMPQVNGLGATEILRRDLPSLKIIILSMLRHAEYVQRVLRSGAHGYVLKEAGPDDLISAIRAVYAGQTYFSPEVARIALQRFVNGPSEEERLSLLSNREQQVLIAIAEGFSNKEIASQLGIGVRTVETHREQIMRKLNIHSVAGLTSFAIAKGLIVLPESAWMGPTG